jgi:hypothetical protein
VSPFCSICKSGANKQGCQGLRGSLCRHQGEPWREGREGCCFQPNHRIPMCPRYRSIRLVFQHGANHEGPGSPRFFQYVPTLSSSRAKLINSVIIHGIQEDYGAQPISPNHQGAQVPNRRRQDRQDSQGSHLPIIRDCPPYFRIHLDRTPRLR